MENLSPRSSVRYSHLRVDSSGNVVNVWNWGDLTEVLNSIDSGQFADRSDHEQDEVDWRSMQGIGYHGIQPRALAEDPLFAGDISGSFEGNSILLSACHVDVGEFPPSGGDDDELGSEFTHDESFYADLPPLEPPEMWNFQHDGVPYLPVIPRLERLFQTPESALLLTLPDRKTFEDAYQSMPGLEKSDGGTKTHHDIPVCHSEDPLDWRKSPTYKLVLDFCCSVLFLHLVVCKFEIPETDHWHMFRLLFDLYLDAGGLRKSVQSTC